MPISTLLAAWRLGVQPHVVHPWTLVSAREVIVVHIRLLSRVAAELVTHDRVGNFIYEVAIDLLQFGDALIVIEDAALLGRMASKEEGVPEWSSSLLRPLASSG